MNRYVSAVKAIGLASALAMGSAASATTYTLSVSGTLSTNPQLVSNEIDTIGLFGTVGRNLQGLPFQALYTIDDSEPWVITPPGVGSTTTVYRSGVNITGSHGSAMVASITIGGVTLFDVGKALPNALSPTGIYTQSIMGQTSHASGQDNLSINIQSSPGTTAATRVFNGVTYTGLSVSVASGFSNRGRLGLNLFGNGDGTFADFAFSPVDVNTTASFHLYTGAVEKFFSAYVDVQYVSIVENVAPVPEPGEWAMIGAGLAIVGGVARKRQLKPMRPAA